MIFNMIETVAKALEGVERVLLVHNGQVPFDVIIQWAQTVVDLSTRPGSTVKVIGKVYMGVVLCCGGVLCCVVLCCCVCSVWVGVGYWKVCIAC